MKIFLATNIFISAFYFKGDSRIILERVLKGVDELYISKEIVDEIFSVMRRPKFKTDIKYIDRFIKLIEEISENILTKGKVGDIGIDGNGNKILECALVAEVNYLVTCDGDLLSLGTFKEIKIVSSNEYLKICFNLD